MRETPPDHLDADRIFDNFLIQARSNQLGREAATAVSRLEPSSVEWLRTVARLVYPIRKNRSKMVDAAQELLEDITRIRTEANVPEAEKRKALWHGIDAIIDAIEEGGYSRALDNLGQEIGYSSVMYQTEALRIIVQRHLLRFIGESE